MSDITLQAYKSVNKYLNEDLTAARACIKDLAGALEIYTRPEPQGNMPAVEALKQHAEEIGKCT